MARRAAAAAKAPAPLAPSVRIQRFFERRLRHGKGEFAGRRFRLEPWELEDIQGIYDPLIPQRGALVREVREALIGLAKKAGKSHIAAGLGAYGLFADGYYVADGEGSWRWQTEYGAEVYNVAGSKPQAKVLFAIGSGFVLRDPMLRQMSRVYKDAIEVPETESVWRVLAADAKLAHGPNPSTAIIDELWVHKDAELYESFASAGAARRQPLLITITTAGWDQDSIAHAQYRRGLDERRDRSFYFHWRQAPDGCRIDDTKAWRTANPSRWVSIAYLRGELKRARRLGLESQFRRWHLNQWTSSKEEAIPMDLWNACGDRPRIPKRIPDPARVVIAVDAAPKHDSTGIALVYKDAEGLHNARVSIMHADPDTGYLDFDSLEATLRELHERYGPARILVDPHFMIRSMLLLAEEGLPIEEFPQGDAMMVPASMNLYELLIGRRLRHGGGRELRRQVQAAAKRITERGWRFTKRRSTGNIDGLIALTMASFILERPEEGEPEAEPFILV